MINSRALPKGVCPELLNSTVTSHTLVGSFETKRHVTLDFIILLEFDKSKTISGQNALVFTQSSCRYNLIMGTDFLHRTQMTIDYDLKCVRWFKKEVQMKEPGQIGLARSLHNMMEDEDEFVNSYMINAETAVRSVCIVVANASSII